MSDGTEISWAEATWNVVSGCTRVRGNHWKGGRSITSHGYVIVWEPEHPAADVRGYVYEHRLVMEVTLGRPLTAGEKIRHKDGNPANNSPHNLALVSPLDRTATAQCGCGCGATFNKLDSAGRPRRFVSGHNTVRLVDSRRRPRCETGAGLDQETREFLTWMFDGQCAYGCGRRASTWDHLIPWACGGSFRRPGNTVPACRSCNSRKSGTHDVTAWVERGWHSNPEAWAQVTTDGYVLGDLADIDDAEEGVA